METTTSPAPRATDERAPIRLAVIDTDRGFLQVFVKRMEALSWEHRLFVAPPRFDDLVPLRLGALVIDLNVLGSHGWSYLETLCRRLPDLPVVVCSGPSTVAQRVRGLRLGADDWLNKPCHPEELLARVEAAVRRRARAVAPASASVEAGEVEIRPDQFQAYVGGVSLDLTKREFELVHLLADAGGRVLPREEIYQRVWGWAMAHGDRSVDVFVRKVRQKLEKGSPGWRYVHTHFGVGYRFAAEAAGAAPAPEEVAPVAAEVAAPPAAAWALDEPVDVPVALS
jgi:DNA-binding response OmpR family regulator